MEGRGSKGEKTGTPLEEEAKDRGGRTGNGDRNPHLVGDLSACPRMLRNMSTRESMVYMGICART